MKLVDLKGFVDNGNRVSFETLEVLSEMNPGFLYILDKKERSKYDTYIKNKQLQEEKEKREREESMESRKRKSEMSSLENNNDQKKTKIINN